MDFYGYRIEDSARDGLSSLEFKRFPPPSRQFRVFCHLQAFVIDVPYLQFISAHCAALDAATQFEIRV